jgi:hypothetical protein
MLKLIKQSLFLLLLLPIPLLLAFYPSPRAPRADIPIYTDALDAEWQQWPWNDVTVDYANTSPVHTGTYSLAVTFTEGWDGFNLGYHGAQLDVSSYDTLRFYIHGGASGGQQVTFQLGSISQVITLAAGAWTQVDISLLPLGTPRSIYSFAWVNDTSGTQPIFYLDDIAVVNSGLPTPAPSATPAPGAGPALSVDAASNQHAISPYIYGMNFASAELAGDLNLPVRRWGGNSKSRYNWQNDTTNTGSDWYFENVPEEENAADLFVQQDRGTGTKTLLTVPLIGWVAKRRPDGHPFDCGFSITKYGNQQDADWSWDPDCGNGVLTNGTEITGNDPTDTSVAITSAFVTGWVNHLAAAYGTASQGGVMFYDLDNEPMLWNSTHRDVHPDPTSYDELRDQTWSYAAAIKAADPSAQTLGPVVWGWCAYFYSAVDGCGVGSDYTAHNNTYFVPWYLQQMKAYQDAHGVRILDYLDMHYYPQAEGVALSTSAGSSATQALRLRSTRSLWDPTYEDESWIADVAEGPYVRLIPRMKEWVAANYPATRLAITEYNWGALAHINGALTQADVLGIFGREGLDLATLWDPPAANEPGAFAFRMYLNYDGTGSAFGETSIYAASADQELLSIYAARRSSSGALTLIVINKTAAPLTSDLSLSNFAPAAWAQVYRYSANNLAAIVQAADQAVSASGFTAQFPANSITLLVIPSAGPPPPPVMYLPLIIEKP